MSGAGLDRHLAPITPEGWDEIDRFARDTLKVYLAARRLVDFTGPLGWEASAVSTGYVDPVGADLGEDVRVSRRRVRPLVELRAPFALLREELEAVARGGRAPDLAPLVDAAKRIASAEDRLVFSGVEEVGIAGMQRDAAHEALVIGDDYTAYPSTVVEALARLQEHGIAGPYAIALGPQCFRGLTRTTAPAGFPVLEHVRELLDGPIVSAQALSGALVVSLRGGDFELVVGRDLSIGYLDHDSRQVQLYLEESLTFRLHGADAVVPLVYPGDRDQRSG